jgi:Asp-tRNA(Asn)/Glu-tRNA(Gln) amidotransferase C subunit
VSVERAEVDRIAALARLRLGSSEGEALTADMNRILQHVDRLQGAVALGSEAPADASAEDAATSSGGLDETPTGRLLGVREGAADSPDPLTSAIADFAPDLREGFFVVPPPHGVGSSSSTGS